MAEHEHELDGPVTLRRQPASLSTGHAAGGTGTFEIICRECGDDPGLDYREISPGLRRIRGPYLLRPVSKRSWSTWITTTGPDETATRNARPDFSTSGASSMSTLCRLP